MSGLEDNTSAAVPAPEAPVAAEDSTLALLNASDDEQDDNNNMATTTTSDENKNNTDEAETGPAAATTNGGDDVTMALLEDDEEADGDSAASPASPATGAGDDGEEEEKGEAAAADYAVQQVWVLCEGSPWWPARIISPPEGVEIPEGFDACVLFYGTGDMSFIQSYDTATVYPYGGGNDDAALRAAAEADPVLTGAIEAADAEAPASRSGAAINDDDDDAALIKKEKKKKDKKDKKDKKKEKEREREQREKDRKKEKRQQQQSAALHDDTSRGEKKKKKRDREYEADDDATAAYMGGVGDVGAGVSSPTKRATTKKTLSKEKLKEVADVLLDPSTTLRSAYNHIADLADVSVSFRGLTTSKIGVAVGRWLGEAQNEIVKCREAEKGESENNNDADDTNSSSNNHHLAVVTTMLAQALLRSWYLALSVETRRDLLKKERQLSENDLPDDDTLPDDGAATTNSTVIAA